MSVIKFEQVEHYYHIHPPFPNDKPWYDDSDPFRRSPLAEMFWKLDSNTKIQSFIKTTRSSWIHTPVEILKTRNKKLVEKYNEILWHQQ